MNPAAHSYRLQGFPSIWWVAPSRCDVVSLFTKISRGQRWPKSCVREIQMEHSLIVRMSADVCLNFSPGSYMEQMLNILECCMVSIAILSAVMLKIEILLWSSRSSVPTSTYMTQVASMGSISCNIEILAQQQSHHKIQWSMLWKRTFHHYQQAIMGNQPSAPHDDVIKRMQTWAAWRLKGSEHLEHCAACDLKSSLRQGNDVKHTFWAMKSRWSGLRNKWMERPIWQESELKTQWQQLSRSRKIWEMLKRRDWQPQSLKDHLRR